MNPEECENIGVEVSEEQVADLYENQGIRGLTMRDLWGEDMKMVFYGKKSNDDILSSIFASTLYVFMSSQNSMEFIAYIVNTFKKIQAISGNSKIKHEFQDGISKLLDDSEAIFLIFKEIKISPVEEDIEKPILSKEIFKKILKKLLPKILQKCQNRENYETERFAAVTARIIWYLVILAVEFTRATWHNERPSKLMPGDVVEEKEDSEGREDVKVEKKLEKDSEDCGKEVEVEKKKEKEQDETENVQKEDSEELEEGGLVEEKEEENKQDEIDPPSSTPTPSPPLLPKFQPFVVKRISPPKPLINGLNDESEESDTDNDNDNQKNKYQEERSKFPLIPYGISTDSQDSDIDSPVPPASQRSIDIPKKSRWDDKEESPKKAIDKATSDKEMIRKQREEEKKAEELERKRFLEEMDRKDREDRSKERIGLRELDKMTRNQKKKEKKRMKKMKSMERREMAEEFSKRESGPIDWLPPRNLEELEKNQQKEVEDQMRSREDRRDSEDSKKSWKDHRNSQEYREDQRKESEEPTPSRKDREGSEDSKKSRKGSEDPEEEPRKRRKSRKHRKRSRNDREEQLEELDDQRKSSEDPEEDSRKSRKNSEDPNDPEDHRDSREDRENQKDQQKAPEEPKKQKKPWKRWEVPGTTSDGPDQQDKVDSEEQMDQSQQKDPEEPRQRKTSLKSRWDQRPEGEPHWSDYHGLLDQQKEVDLQKLKDQNQIVPIDWVDFENDPKKNSEEKKKDRGQKRLWNTIAPKDPRKDDEQNIDFSRRSVDKPKKTQHVDHPDNSPKPFQIIRARLNVSSHWPFISVRSANVCSSMDPRILRNRPIFTIFRIFVGTFNSNAARYRDEFLRNQKEPLTLEQLIRVLEDMCERCLEGTSMYEFGLMLPLAQLFTSQSVTIDFKDLSDFGRHLLSFFYEQCEEKINDFEFNACFEFLVKHMYHMAVDIIPYLVKTTPTDGLYHIRPNLIAHTRHTFLDQIDPPELLGRLCRLHTLTHSLLLRSPNSSTLWTTVPLEDDHDKLLELLLEPGLSQALPEVVRDFLTIWMRGVQRRMQEMVSGKLQKIAREVFKISEFEEIVDEEIRRNCSKLVHRVLSEVLNCPKKQNFLVFDGLWADFIDTAIREPWGLLDTISFKNSKFEELVDSKKCPCFSYVGRLFPGRQPIKYIRKHTLLQLLRFTVTLALQTIRHVAIVTKNGPSEFSIRFSKSFETNFGVEEEKEPVEQPVVKKRKEGTKKRSVFIPPPSCSPARSPSVAGAAPNRTCPISIPMSPVPRPRSISLSAPAQPPEPEDILAGLPEKWRLAYLHVLSFNEELIKERETMKMIKNVLEQFKERL